MADKTSSLPLSSDSPNELAVIFDRRRTGEISVYLDGKPISNGTLPLLASSSAPGEIWIISDTGFRGDCHRFCMYADALQPHKIAQPRKLPLSLHQRRSSKAPDVYNHSPEQSRIPLIGPRCSTFRSINHSFTFLLGPLLLLVVIAAAWRHGTQYTKYL